MVSQAVQKKDPTYFDFDIGGLLARTYAELLELEPVLRQTARALGNEEQWPTLRGKLSAELSPGSLVLRISAVDRDPGRAKRMADAAAHQLVAAAASTGTSELPGGFVESQAMAFPSKIEAAQEEILELEGELADAFGARRIQEIQGQIRILEGQVLDWQSAYVRYQQLLNQGSINVLQVLEEAPLPANAVSSALYQGLLTAAGIGLMLGTLGVVVLENLDDTIKSPDQVSNTLQLSAVGAVPHLHASEPKQRLVSVRQPRSPATEAYRTLRTNLSFLSVDHPLRSLVITSANPQEGKSTTLANLGVVTAQAGKSVILVDCDLRRPMVHRIFGLPNRHGLTNLLLQAEPTLNGYLRDTEVANLRVLTSGPLPPNPSEVLGSERMRELIAQLQEGADLVLLDVPPVLPVTDGVILAARADGALVVAGWGMTRRAQVGKAVQGLKHVGADVLGVVLSRLRIDRHSYYRYHGYDVYSRAKSRKRTGRLPEQIADIPDRLRRGWARAPGVLASWAAELRGTLKQVGQRGVAVDAWQQGEDRLAK
jgi:non-specific protein-tyrosine kinase